MFLVLALYFAAGMKLVGSLIVATLKAGFTTTMPILYAAVAGFTIAAPVTWLVTRKLRGLASFRVARDASAGLSLRPAVP